METSFHPASDPEAWAAQFTASLCAQRDRARQFFAAQQTRLERAEAFVEQELHRLEEDLRKEREETEQLRAQRNATAARLTKMEAQLVETEQRLASLPDDRNPRPADEELQCRYQSSLDELRQSKNTCSELQEQLVKARSAATKLARQAQQPGQLDWETQKKQILAALEADSDDGDDQAASDERAKIEGVLRTTEKVVAAKDGLIQELKARLEERGGLSAAGAPNTASVGYVLDNDAVIQQERETLHQLQSNFRERLRKAEVEMATERATIARERAELEEHLRALQNGVSAPQQPAEPATGQSGGSRWLARLGLTDADRPSGRQF